MISPARVEHILDAGRRRLVTISTDAGVCEATALLEEVTNEELLLRDYVLGIGYQ